MNKNKYADVHDICIHEPKRDGYTYEKMCHVYNRQEMADRIEMLFQQKHEIEFAMSHRPLTIYETKKFYKVKYEIEEILSELLRDFTEPGTWEEL